MERSSAGGTTSTPLSWGRCSAVKTPASWSPSSSVLGLHHHPAPSLELGGQLLGRHPTQRLVGGRQANPWCRRRGRLARGLYLLQTGDELVGLVAGELAPGLALREAHRPPGITKVGMTSGLQQ